jgi:mannitol operon repressor
MNGDALADFNAFLKEFQDETERGAALVGAAMIEEKLKETLLAFFAEPDVGPELLDPVGGGPLSTMVARAKIALCLGLIDRDELQECKTISKIRNAFAHWPHGTTFHHPEIMKHCGRLRIAGQVDPAVIKENPRYLFTQSVFLTVLGLSTRSQYAAEQKLARPIKTWPVIWLDAAPGAAR